MDLLQFLVSFFFFLQAIKIGIGPGSVCTTRRQTGVGYPQLSAVIECADAAHGLGGHVIADGGLKCPGDFAKAFGAGGDFCMAGGVFAGRISIVNMPVPPVEQY